MDSGALWKSLPGSDSALGAGVCVERSEDGDEALHDAGAEGEEVELSLAANLDEAGGFELLDVVGEGGGGDGEGGAGFSAAQRAAGPGDALEQLEAARIGQRLEDGGAAGAREAEGSGGRFQEGFLHFDSGYWMLPQRNRHFSGKSRG